MKRAFYWFRNDLRLEDNRALTRAAEDCGDLIPVYVFDDAIALRPFLGFERMGAFRKKFLWESLHDLREELSKQGGGLIIKQGDLPVVFEDLRAAYDCDIIYCTEAIGTEERDQERALKACGFDVRTIHDHCLYHKDDLPFELNDAPEVYTPFRKKLEKYADVRPLQPMPGFKNLVEVDESILPPPALDGIAKEVDDRSAFPFKGGRIAAKERLKHYLWESNLITSYKETRNGLVGMDYSSKLSAWLSLGCISAREVYHEVKRYEGERKKNSSTYWLIFELIWRDFFQFMLMKHRQKLFLASGIQGGATNWTHDEKRLLSWINGETKNDFINANMREIKETGFMSNRGRQVVASYLINDLNCDWRYGAAYFESVLIDYNAASNYGNWQYIAGVGNDPRPDRYFNPKTQAERYDPEQAFQRMWLN